MQPLACCSFGATGCSDSHTQTALDYTDNARKDYEAALAAFEDKNWELANELLSEVKRKYAYSRYARLAELRLADGNFQQDKYAEAISGYKEFVHDHPNDPKFRTRATASRRANTNRLASRSCCRRSRSAIWRR